MGQLGRGKRNHGVGAIGIARKETPRVGVPTGGEIHRNHRSLGVTLQQLAAGNCQTVHGGTKTSAQDGVEKQLRGFDSGFAVFAVQVGFFLDADRDHGKPLQHDLGVALRLGRVAKHHDRDGTAGFREMTRGYQAITAVVAFAAQHDNAPALRQFTQNEAGQCAAGMLHQFKGRDAEAVGGNPIGGRHLVSGQYLHC